MGASIGPRRAPRLGWRRSLTLAERKPSRSQGGAAILRERYRKAGRIQEGGDSLPLCVHEMIAKGAKTLDERREPWSKAARGSRTSYGATGTRGTECFGCWRWRSIHAW